MVMKVGAVILAAGMSRRMGKTKQLVKYNDKYLLEMVIQRVLKGKFLFVYSVIGYDAKKVRSSIKVDDPRFQWVVNDNYKSGIGSSLKVGIQEALKNSDSVMIFLGDVPFFKDETVQSILQKGKKMRGSLRESIFIQPSYHGQPGHPVFLGNINAQLIEELHGDQGAKAFLNQFPWKKQISVNDLGVVYDIDTPEALDKAKNWHYPI